MELHAGTITFLFSDIEGSTELLKRLGDAGFARVLEEHHRTLRETFAARSGREIDSQGDAFFYAFSRARDAVGAAVEAQRGLAEHPWPEGSEVRVRMGLHTGEPVIGEDGYTGLDVVRAARIAAVGRGGQVLLSETTRALIGPNLPEGRHRPLARRTAPEGHRPPRAASRARHLRRTAIDRHAPRAARRARPRDIRQARVATHHRASDARGRARARGRHAVTGSYVRAVRSRCGRDGACRSSEPVAGGE